MFFSATVFLLVGELLALNQTVGFCNLYAACVEAERKILWKGLANSMNSFSIPWIVGGDFNTILKASERSSSSQFLGSMRSFKDFLSDARVIDLPL